MQKRLAYRLVSVAVLLSAVSLLAESWPQAPELTSPPILSEAKLWLDAWDPDTIQTDENGFVTNWVDKSSRRADARAYEGAVLGTMGVTNGVPAFLMGEPGSGIDLEFAHLSNVRSVFWVMDIAPGDQPKAQFLADSIQTTSTHFSRGSDGIFTWTVAAFPARLWLGDTQLFTWDSRRWSARDNKAGMTGLQVYSLSSDSDLAADRLSAPYGGGVGKASGGRALSELIVFDRTLSNDEILMVKSYLNAKWKGFQPVTIDEQVTPSSVQGYGQLTLGENASFVLTDAVLGTSDAAPVSVWGSFDKSAAGKIRLAYRGHVWRRSQQLFYVAAGGLTLEDFDLSGLPADATVSCDGTGLTMTVGGDILPSETLSVDSPKRPDLWLDASDADSFVTNETGGVLKWLDKSGHGNDATNYWYGGWQYPTVGLTNGVPALLLGKASSGKDLAFNMMDGIRTVFWVMDVDSYSSYASFLGTFTSDSRGQAYQRSSNGRNGFAGYLHYSSPEQTYKGQMREDGQLAKTGTETELRWINPNPGLHVYSHRVKDDVPAWANNLGRCGNVNYLSAGKAISELAIFNRSLSDGERLAVERYLMLKWNKGGVETIFDTEQTLTAPDSYGELAVDKASRNYQEVTTGSIVLGPGALTVGAPAITVYGEFRRREAESVDIRWAGGEMALGTYAILTCANLFNCTAADFRFVDFPDNARFSWEGTTLKVTFLAEPQPLVPRVLAATDEAAPWLWLDASDADTFTTNAQGGVLAWADKGARGNDATAYQLGDEQRYGALGQTNGVSAYLMDGCGSGVDLGFARTTTARTMFWVMDIALDSRAFFLGDTEAVNFQRGGTGQYCFTGNLQKPFSEGVVREDGDIPHDKKTHGEEYEIWRCKPYPPGSTHVYSLQAADDMAASCLSADRGCTAPAAADANGGRALSELVIFNRALTAAEVADVEAYMDLKWFGTTKTVSSAVDAVGRVSYPNLICADGAAFAVKSSSLEADGESAVTVHGFCEKTGDGKIVITNVTRRTRRGVVLFRCAGSYGLSLDSFEFDGFPEGTTFAWENDELKVADCPVPGLLLIVR